MTTFKVKPTKGSTPFKLQWTRKDRAAAQKQGWDLFDAGYRFEIEVVTENPAGFDEGQDDDAVAWLIRRATRGDALAAKGLLIAGLVDPQWFASDLTHAVKTGHVTVLDTKRQPTKPQSIVEFRKESSWENDFHQFARLICELNAAGAPNKKQLKVLMESMDLSTEDIHQLLDRAEAAWFKIKDTLNE